MSNCTIIILGATGDLSRRKLFPALYRLITDKKVKKFAVIGVSIDSTTIDEVIKRSMFFIPHKDQKILNKILKFSSYVQLDFYQDVGYGKLKKEIESVEKKHGLPGNRIFYFATMPEHFVIITEKLAQHNIVHKQEKSDIKKKWSRVVYEKPFGQNLASARRINRVIANVFSEEQTYRIDHYLGKELIGNIAIVRFTNLFLEPLWNKKYIDSVQIISTEKIGIQGRGAYYDQYGVIKDVVQNHMLQMLALIAMEPPSQLAGEEVRDAKVAVLKKVKIEDGLLGQYQGYANEVGVPDDSRTPTFVALRLSINNKRWAGVPFYCKAGKFLDKKETSIHIKFKHPRCLLAQGCPTEPNYLTIRVQPEAGFFLELNAKVPDKAYEITPVKMDFCHTCIFGPNSPGAYEVLLIDIMRGDQSAFVRFDEIEYSWKAVDNFIHSYSKLYSYKKRSKGPQECVKFNKKYKLGWRT